MLAALRKRGREDEVFSFVNTLPVACVGQSLPRLLKQKEKDLRLGTGRELITT